MYPLSALLPIHFNPASFFPGLRCFPTLSSCLFLPCFKWFSTKCQSELEHHVTLPLKDFWCALIALEKTWTSCPSPHDPLCLLRCPSGLPFLPLSSHDTCLALLYQCVIPSPGAFTHTFPIWSSHPPRVHHHFLLSFWSTTISNYIPDNFFVVRLLFELCFPW